MKSKILVRVFEAVVVVVCLSIFGWFTSSGRNVRSLDIKNTAHFQTDKTVQIKLEGEVTSPGIYTVLQGTSLYDAISKAGGVTDDADLSEFDLSLPVISDTTLMVPAAEGELPVEMSSFSGAEAVEPPSENSGLSDKPCNINTSSASELEALPGIGKTIADRIVDYRTRNGAFSVIEDIKNVEGIGDKIYEKIKNSITVGN